LEGKGIEHLTVTEYENGDRMKLGPSRQEERSVDDENKSEEEMIIIR
jgi:hypothetical protein